MTVTQRQYSHLSEMGINVWQSRHNNNSVADSNESPDTQSLIKINADELATQILFLDVLHSIDCEIGDITIKNHTVDLGLINWQFSESNTITFDHNILTTPSLSQIGSNTQLKKDLWKTLNQEVLS